MSVTTQVATLDWACDRTETFWVSQDVMLPGWTAADLVGGKWLMHARYPLDNNEAALVFESGPAGTITQDAVVDGAGVDSNDDPIPGVTVTLTFRQSDAIVARAPLADYPIAIKFISAAGVKTIVASGQLKIKQGPTW